MSDNMNNLWCSACMANNPCFVQGSDGMEKCSNPWLAAINALLNKMSVSVIYVLLM